ncbi:AAA family ATPase [Lactococcus raffinolactis]|uniref:ATP-binding protein n=1 Tax=Pseudolactococcus raffinolactis TaxID=1366 RepID=UPI00143673F4|nr:ATP-binding protein [Lactococcus raffinolactis]QIW60313.1 AAA family ATPase [Lactococcus raffinolactis]
MSFNITSGPTATAQKVVLYGVEGIGKSTFASQFPNPVFIDTEGSTSNMNVQRLDNPNSWQMLLDEVNYVKQSRICSTLIIDSADWSERICKEHLAVLGKWTDSNNDYGAKYIALEKEFGLLINKLSDLVELGINVVLTAHAKLKKKEEPDQMGAFDRYQLKMEDKTGAIVKEWADMVLFANYEMTVLTDEKTKSKKATGGHRVMYATHYPGWDAKNRHGLPDKLPFEFGTIAHIFNETHTPVQEPEPQEAPVVETQPEQVELIPTPGAWTPGGGEVADTSANQNQFSRDPIVLDPGIDPQLAQLMTANGVTEDEVKAVVVEKGFMPAEVSVKDYPSDLVQGGLVAQWANIFAQITAKRGF